MYAVAEFLINLDGLAIPFVVVMGAVFVIGALWAARHVWQLDAQIKNLAQRYRDEPLDPSQASEFAWCSIEPTTFLKLQLEDDESARHTLDSIPGLLVTVGILGTFIGLGLALTEAEGLFSEDPKQTLGALKALLQTLAFKFQTSAWGILLSLAFETGVRLPFEHKIEAKMEAAAQQMMPHHRSSSRAIDELKREIAPALTSIGPALHSHGRAVGDAANALSQSTPELIYAVEQLSGLSGSIAAALASVGNQITEASDQQASRLAENFAGVNDKLENALREQGAVLRSGTESLQEAGEKQSRELTASMSEVSRTINASLTKMNESLEKALEEQTRQLTAQSEQLRAFESYQGELNATMKQVRDINSNLQKQFERVLDLVEKLQGEASGKDLLNMTTGFEDYDPTTIVGGGRMVGDRDTGDDERLF